MGDESPPAGKPRLSATQVRLLQMVAAGTTSSKALAVKTGLSPRSIDTYLHSAARELGCEGRIAAAAKHRHLELTSQLSSQLRAEEVATGRKSGISRWASIVIGFFTGLPLGGSSPPASAVYVTLQILRVGVIGSAGIAMLVLFLLGFLKVFR